MLIKEIEKEKCGNCPLIDECGDPFSDPCLCLESRLSGIDVDVYKSCYSDEPYENIEAKALELGFEIKAPEDIPEDEKDEWEDDNDCLNNHKFAFMELFLDNPNTSSFEEFNK